MAVTNPEKGETVRTLLTIMLLAAAVLPALSQAQTVNICDRTPQVRDAILRKLGLSDCAAVDAERLANFEILNIRQKQMMILRVGDFADLTSLVALGFWDNQLANLPEGVFAGLSSLQYLGLWENQLSALPEGVFHGLTSLETLYLSSNRLSA